MAVGIRQLGRDELIARLEDFADLLIDCVEGGASIGFLSPLSRPAARGFWTGIAEALDGRVLLAAFDGDTLIGTAQLIPASLPNQLHRADVSKMMVRRSARGRGAGSALLAAIEDEARRVRRTLLVLDTATGSDAERLYVRHGWKKSGVIPDYALWPDGSPCATTFYYRRLES